MPVGIDLGDLGGAWPAIEEGEQAFEGGAVAFGGDFDGAISLIAYPSGEAKFAGTVLGGVAEADALDSTVYNGVELVEIRFGHDL